MNNTVRNHLIRLIQTYGYELITDPRRLYAFLKDLCGAHRKEINVLVIAAKEGIPERLLKSNYQIPIGVLTDTLAVQLSDATGLTDSAALWAVKSWAVALNTISNSNQRRFAMAYQKKVARANPELIVMILDDSGSMASALAGGSDARYEWVERYSGIILKELLARSTEVRGGQPEVKPRYYLDVIMYGGTPTVWNKKIDLDIGEAVEQFSQQSHSFGLGGKLGGTDAKAAFRVALQHVQTAVQDTRFKDSFPPMIFHLTDGESATDAEPEAQQLMSLTTSDGNVLVVNAYIGTSTALNYTDPNDFPGYVDEQDVGGNDDNLRLFRMSSVMPDTIRENLVNDGIFPAIRENARLFFDVRTKEMLKHVMQVVGSGGSRMAK